MGTQYKYILVHVVALFFHVFNSQPSSKFYVMKTFFLLNQTYLKLIKAQSSQPHHFFFCEIIWALSHITLEIFHSSH